MPAIDPKPRVRIVTAQKAQRIAEPGTASPAIETRSYFANASDTLQLQVHELAAGACWAIADAPTLHAIYIWHGAVIAAGVRLDERSSALVERGASLSMTAGMQGAHLLAFSAPQSDAQSVAQSAGGAVHLLPSAQVPRNTDLDGTGRTGGSLHADASFPTCRLWLHENDFYQADHETAVHSHSEDEIIFIRSGQIRLGNRLYESGTAIAITAHTKYGFRAGPEGLGFVNFRSRSPTYSAADGSQTLDEAALWRSLTGPPHYLAAP